MYIIPVEIPYGYRDMYNIVFIYKIYIVLIL